MGIISRMERARVENPSVPLSSANVLSALGLEQPTPAGVTVNHDKALGITAFWAGVRIISQTIASLPCEVFERTEGGRRLAQGHNVNRLLYSRPNPFMTPYTFKEIRAAHCLAWGNSYAEIEYDRGGRRIGLWPLLPDRTGSEIRNGKKVFWTVVNGTKIWLDADRVLHVPGLGFDGIQGYNVIKVHRDSLGLSLAANEYGAQFFGNSGKPSGVLTHPGQPDEEERKQFREEWNQMHTGLTRAQRTAVLWGGMDWKQISMPPEEAQFLQTREMQIEEVARILNLNPILLQHFTKATTWGSGIAQFLVAFGKFTIIPWLEREEDVLNWDLFDESERGRYYVKYNANALLRGDSKTQAEVLEIERRNGIRSADEWRELLDENPLPDGQGKDYFMPLNMVAIEPKDDDTVAAGEDVQHTALNGAQIASLLEILAQVTAKLLAPDTAKAALKVAFPSLNDEQINQMVDSSAAFEMPPDAENLRSWGITEKRQASKRERRSTAMRNRLREAHLKAFEDAARRYVKRDAEALIKVVKRAFESGDNPGDSINAWIEEFYPGQERYIYQTMLPQVSALASAIAATAVDEVGADPVDVDTFNKAYTENLARREASSSIGQIRALIAEQPEAELQAILLTRAGEWSETRPGKVAANEVVRVATGAAKFAWSEAGVRHLVWKANAGACPLCKEMDGKRVGIQEYFLTPGESVTPDERPGGIVAGANIAGPPLHQGCTCDIVPD